MIPQRTFMPLLSATKTKVPDATSILNGRINPKTVDPQPRIETTHPSDPSLHQGSSSSGCLLRPPVTGRVENSTNHPPDKCNQLNYFREKLKRLQQQEHQQKCPKASAQTAQKAEGGGDNRSTLEISTHPGDCDGRLSLPGDGSGEDAERQCSSVAGDGANRIRENSSEVEREGNRGTKNPTGVDPTVCGGGSRSGMDCTDAPRGTKRRLDSSVGSTEVKRPRLPGISPDRSHEEFRVVERLGPALSSSNTRGHAIHGFVARGDRTRTMATDELSSYIWDFYEAHQQSKDTYIKKMRLRDELYAVMKNVFPYCGLYVIGSSMNGFGGSSSDMDLCLMLCQNEIDQKKEALDILKVLQLAFSRCSFLHNVRLIQAKVPILKFTDVVSKVECDLNINNSVGIRNTHLLRCYSSLDWRVAPLVLFVKCWAKSNEINDASCGTISSYSLELMVIHYLQQGCSPPLMPSLQQKYPHKFDATKDVRLITLNENLAPYASPNGQSLSELFVGFVDYYCCKFRFDTEAISVRLGRSIHQSLVQSHNPVPGSRKYICIEEPFNLTNTAHSVFDQRNFRRIMEVFRSCRLELSRTRPCPFDPRTIFPAWALAACRQGGVAGGRERDGETPVVATSIAIITTGSTAPAPSAARDLRVALVTPGPWTPRAGSLRTPGGVSSARL